MTGVLGGRWKEEQVTLQRKLTCIAFNQHSAAVGLRYVGQREAERKM